MLCLPTAPTEAPFLDASREELAKYRRRTFLFTALAGLARLPQATIPAAHAGRPPIGISLIAARGQDRALLRLASEIGRGLESSGETG